MGIERKSGEDNNVSMFDQSGSEELISEVITEWSKLFWGKNQRQRSRHKTIMAGAGPRNSKERSRLEQSPRNDYSQRREKSEDQNLRGFQPINLEGDEEEQVEEMDGVDHW